MIFSSGGLEGGWGERQGETLWEERGRWREALLSLLCCGPVSSVLVAREVRDLLFLFFTRIPFRGLGRGLVGESLSDFLMVSICGQLGMEGRNRLVFSLD